MANPNLKTEKEVLTPAEKEFKIQYAPLRLMILVVTCIDRKSSYFHKSSQVRGEALDHVLFHGLRA